MWVRVGAESDPQFPNQSKFACRRPGLVDVLSADARQSVSKIGLGLRIVGMMRSQSIGRSSDI